MPRTARVLLVVACALPAWAEKPIDREIARKHFEMGSLFFEKGDFRGAVEQFEKGFRLTGLAKFQYNIAQCYEKLFKPEQALAAYHLYLRDAKPTGDEREYVESRIVVLKDAIEEKRATRAPPPSPPAPPRPSPSPPALVTAPAEPPLLPPALSSTAFPDKRTDLTEAAPAPTRERPFYHRWPFWAATGAVVAGAVVGAVLATRGGGGAVAPPCDGLGQTFCFDARDNP